MPPTSGSGHWNQRLATHLSRPEVTDFRIASAAAEALDIPLVGSLLGPTHLEGGASKIIRC